MHKIIIIIISKTITTTTESTNPQNHRGERRRGGAVVVDVSGFPVISLFFFFVRCVPETSQVFRAHFFYFKRFAVCSIQVSRISSSSSSLLYVHSFIVWLYIQRATFFLFRSLLSREEKGKFFSEVLRCSRLSTKKF